MPRIDIKTTLSCCPKPKQHEMIYITRGATASFNFPLADKVYKFKDIVQMTFSFRQGKQLWWYNMIEYFIQSEDIEVDPTKNYYHVTPVNKSRLDENECVAEIYEPHSSPKVENCYELIVDPPLDGTEVYWRRNEHFADTTKSAYSYINFSMFPDDTQSLPLTAPEEPFQFEVAIKLDTNSLYGMPGRDAVIIEPQHPVGVIDSIYSHIDVDVEGAGYIEQRAIPSLVTLCATQLLCNKYR